MAVLLRMTLVGKSFLGGPVEIPVAVNLSTSSRMVWDVQSCPQLSTGHCRMALLRSWANLPSRMLLLVMGKFLDSTFQKELRGLLCSAMDMVLNLVNTKFASMMYLPPLTSLPPKREAATQLILAASFLSAELSLMQPYFGLNITNGMVLRLLPLVTMTLGALIPEVSSILPPSEPVVIDMRETQPPLVTITPEKSIVHLFSTAKFWASSPGSAPRSLFILDVHSELGAWFAAAQDRLQFSLVLHSLSHEAVVNSSIGAFNVLPLRGVLADIIHVAYVPSINRWAGAGRACGGALMHGEQL
ncbi:hypothetical protein ASZ78_005467, partial [Callipepla squamata]